MANKNSYFYETRELKISYHTPNSFKSDYFQSAAKVQEVIIQPDSRLTEWAREIVQK